MKKLLISITFALGLIVCCAVAAQAAPDIMNSAPQSSGLLYLNIYNPETVVSTTTQSDYVLSGVAKSGVVVSTYYLEKSTGRYKLAYMNGVPAVQTIGASGYFAQRIQLNEGKNDILIRVDSWADADIPAQVVNLEINLLVDSFWGRFKSTYQNMEKELRSVFK